MSKSIFPLSESEYKKLCDPKRGLLHTTHATKALIGHRKEYEQNYFLHHKSLGVKLRDKYSL